MHVDKIILGSKLKCNSVLENIQPILRQLLLPSNQDIPRYYIKTVHVILKSETMSGSFQASRGLHDGCGGQHSVWPKTRIPQGHQQCIY